MTTDVPPPPRPRPGPWRLTWFALLQVASLVPLVVLLVLWIVGGVLVLVWVGLALLALVVPATRWFAAAHRRMAAEVLGAPVPTPYQPLPPGRPLARLRVVMTDPMTWREVGWLLVAVTLGFVLSLLVLVLLVGVVTAFLWWYAAPPLMWTRAQLDRAFLSYSDTERLQQRVQVLTESRADVVDHSAAELRRLERDLHDGAQARLVALSMSLGMADATFDQDPELARKLVQDARDTTAAAIGDLRSVVRGIHPPVLADRGLGGAVQALALDMAVPVDVEVRLPGRPPAPVESAVYFAVAECLANVGKHSGATRAWVTLHHDRGTLRATVRDDGGGGANAAAGTGLAGVVRRLAAFDGTMRVSSPAGGPTTVSLEVPCALSSPKTTPSSAPG